MQDERWIAVSPAVSQAELEAFRQLRQAMPDGPIHRAWSNFMFSAGSGHCVECDALVMGPGGLYLIEVKSLVGRLIAAGNDWVQLRRGVPPRYFHNALHSTSMKARKLKELLRGPLRGEVPFIHAAVYFSLPNLTIDFAKDGLYGRPPGLGDIAKLFDAGPQRERDRITAVRARQIAAALTTAGIAESPSHHHVGMWKLERKPLQIAETWQDHEASHLEVPHEHRRIRLHLVGRQATAEQRASVERAARREYAALSGIDHPGIVRVDNLEHHAIGPALVYRHDPRSMRLDQYLSAYGDQLPMPSRAGLVRQIAEAMAYAHGQRLFHRSLSARSVLVVPGKGDDDGWLDPRLEVTDWHLASRRHEDETLASIHPTAHVTLHASGVDDCYLAPEWRLRDADPVALDVFGVGALAYALLTATPPAASHEELLRLVAAGNGLRPSSALADVPAFADLIVQEATRPRPADRLRTVEDLLELFNGLEREFGHPAAHVDPLQARAGDEVGEWVIEEVLGAGSVARVFLGRRGEDTREVLKVARSEEQVPLLELEASVLRRLRTDSHVIGLVRPDVIDLGGRATLVLEYVGRETLARRLRNHGPLPPDELESFGDQLIGALAFLEGEAVHHRDVKPDNIVLRVRPNGRTAPVLFDFSLSGTPDDRLDVGTTGYLDPFLGPPHRPRYDHFADWFALAVTLHEMATGELPVWGDGRTAPTLVSSPPTLAAGKFPVSGMTAFFQRALARSVTDRFATLTDLRLAWLALFRPVAAAPVTTFASRPPGAAVPPAAPPFPASPFPAPSVSAPPTAATRTASAPVPPPPSAPLAAPSTTVPSVTVPAERAATPAKGKVSTKTAAVPAAAVPAATQDPAAKAAAGGLTYAKRELARSALAAALREQRPLPLATAGEALKRAAPSLFNSKWAGTKSLRRFIELYLTEFVCLPGDGGGFLDHAGDIAPQPVPSAPAAPAARVELAATTPPIPAKPAPAKPVPAKPVPAKPAPAKPATTVPAQPVARSAPAPPATTRPVAPDEVSSGELRDIRGILDAALAAGGDVPLTAIGAQIKLVVPRIWESKYAGARTLTAFLERHLPDYPIVDGSVTRRPRPSRARPHHQPNTFVRTPLVTFGRDGRTLISSGRDRSVQVWDLATDRLVHTLTGHGDILAHMCLDPSGTILATASYDKAVRLWSLHDGRLLRTLEGVGARWLAFSPDGTALATAAKDASVRLWQISTGQQVARLTGHTGDVLRVAFTHDGARLLTTARDGTMRVWQAGSHRTTHTVEPVTSPRHAAYSSRGGWIAVALTNGTIRLHTLASGHRMGDLAGHSGPIRQVVPARGGTALASIGEDGVLRLWDPANRRQLWEVRQYTRSVNRLVAGPDHLLATIDDDGMVRVRDGITGAVVREISDGSQVPPRFAFAPDGRYAATGGHDGVVRVCALVSSDPPVPVGTSASRTVDRSAVPAPRAEPPADDSPSWIGRLLRRSG